MMKQTGLVFMASVCWLSAGGCGSPAGLYPVSGKVLFKGEPAAGAVVYFHPRDVSAQPGQPIPAGIVGEDGGFVLESDKLGEGARPGAYSVLVEWRDRTGDGVVPVSARGKTKLVKRGRVRTGPDRLNGRYLDAGKPLLHAEIKPGANQLEPFELAL